MPNLLNVQSSSNLTSSASRLVSRKFIDKYAMENEGTDIVDLDLVATPPSHFGPSHYRAFFSTESDHGPENAAAIAASDAYVAQLKRADVLVLGTPMYNFGIASNMKSWVDNILRVGKTFKSTEAGPVGLLSGTKVVIVVASGGVYSSGPMAVFEHCGNYLRDIIMTIGLTDVSIVRAEGLALGPEMAEQGLKQAIAEAETLAVSLRQVQPA